jgi:hypothetical protein
MPVYESTTTTKIVIISKGKQKKERNQHGFRHLYHYRKREVLPHRCGEKVSVQRVKTGNPVSDF